MSIGKELSKSPLTSQDRLFSRSVTLYIAGSALSTIEYSGILSDNEDFAKSCITRCVLERYLHTLDSCQSDNIHSAYTRLAGYITGYCVDIIPCTLRGSSTSAPFQA